MWSSLIYHLSIYRIITHIPRSDFRLYSECMLCHYQAQTVQLGNSPATQDNLYHHIQLVTLRQPVAYGLRLIGQYMQTVLGQSAIA
jgi:hypothetical protein